MAPLPVTNTARLYIEYTAAGREHTAVVRVAEDGLVDLLGVYDTIAPAMAELMNVADTITGARYSAQGSNLSFPLPGTSPYPGTQTGTIDEDLAPNFLSFTGRSLAGRRTRFTLFTALVDLKNTGYRDESPSGGTADLLEALVAAEPAVVAIDGGAVVWNSYANYGSNAYWQRQERKN